MQEPSLYTIKAVFILDNDGHRLLAKVTAPPHPRAPENCVTAPRTEVPTPSQERPHCGLCDSEQLSLDPPKVILSTLLRCQMAGPWMQEGVPLFLILPPECLLVILSSSQLGPEHGRELSGGQWRVGPGTQES